jgi:hypothetical protein
MTAIDYEVAREQIKSGDIVAFRTTKKSVCFARFLKFFLGHEIYHIGFAIWLSSPDGQKRLFVVEAAGGNRQIVPLSNYANEPLDVYKCPVKFSDIEGALIERVGQINYSYFDLISIWLKEKFHIKFKNFKGQVCSEMVIDILREGGLDLGNELVSPQKIVDEFEIYKIGFRVRTIGEI